MSKQEELRFAIATTQLEMMQVAAIRGICNVEETGVPCQFEFDDNDQVSTHLLAFRGDEPIATIRLRFFGEFVKLERACVRPNYRDRHILPACIEEVKRYAGRKGFRRIVTHAKPSIARLWRMMGFTIVQDKAPAQFQGMDVPYVELWGDIPPRNDAIGLDSPTYMLFRQESALDRANAYEMAA